VFRVWCDAFWHSICHECIKVNFLVSDFSNARRTSCALQLVFHGPTTWMQNSSQCRKTVLTRRGWNSIQWWTQWCVGWHACHVVAVMCTLTASSSVGPATFGGPMDKWGQSSVGAPDLGWQFFFGGARVPPPPDPHSWLRLRVCVRLSPQCTFAHMYVWQNHSTPLPGDVSGVVRTPRNKILKIYHGESTTPGGKVYLVCDLDLLPFDLKI